MLCISKYFIDICNYKLVLSPQGGHCDWASGEKKKDAVIPGGHWLQDVGNLA